MSESNDMGRTSISHAGSLEEIAQFWDTHSLDDHWDETHEVVFEVRALQRRRITLDPELYGKIEAQARQRGILPETLVNIWLAERVREA
jgi:hypothetical protein